jgi:hypothetical protein
LPHLGSQDGLDILVRALVHETPRSFTALIQALQRQVPEALPAIQRTLLEFTRYALFSPGAAPRYQRVYQAKLDFLRGRISKQQYQDEKTSWQAWRQEQRQRIEAGATLMATVVDPIEVLTLSGLSLDLNGDPESLVSGIEGLLKEMGSSDPALAHPDRVLARILRSREHRGGRFEDMKDLREVLPQELFEVLCEGNRRAQAEIEARLEAVARRLGQRRLRDSFVVEPDPRFFTGSVSETSPASWDR